MEMKIEIENDLFDSSIRRQTSQARPPVPSLSSVTKRLGVVI
jgi:hypothetical protein